MNNFSNGDVLFILNNNRDKAIASILLYERIQEIIDIRRGSISKCYEFIYRFDGLYKLTRERKKKFDFSSLSSLINQNEYYKKIENLYKQNMHKKITYDQCLFEVSKISGQCEKVFASKLLHTINNQAVIMDNKVYKKLMNIPLRANDCKTSITKYNQFECEFKKFLKVNKNIINKEFNIFCKNNGIKLKYTKVNKKLDFILWFS